MLNLIIFITSYFYSEIIFASSKNFTPELFFNDINRFIGIENIKLVDIVLSLLIAITNLIIFKIFKPYLKNLEKKLYLISYLLTVNLISSLSIFYFLRIYTVSRLYLIIIIFLYPLTVFLISQINLKFKFLSYIILIFIASVGFIVTIYEDQNLQENTEQQKNLNSKRPLDYYPNLDMELVGGETNKIEIFPGYESILLEYNSFNNQLINRIKFEEKYELDVYSICCYWLEYVRSGGKPVGYLENYNQNLIYVHGSGFISFVDKANVIDGNFKFQLIDSNFHEIINNIYIYQRDKNFKNGWPDWWESVRDVIIIENKIYISFVNEKTKDCVNIEIVEAEFNFDYLFFDYFFRSDECVMRTEYPFYNGMVAGGKLVNLNNTELILSTGDFRIWEKAQDDNSYLGKIISINIDNKEYKIISKGHRNPQGLALTHLSNYLIETEHGPVGGDEINLINVDEYQNFGWPISSYGKHWFPENYEDKGGIAPLYNSHEEYGMREPLFYQYVGYFGGIGISDIEINYFNNNHSFFVATLNGRQIFEIDVNIEENKMTSFTRYQINERIRDLEYDPINNVYFLILEDSPAIGVFKPISNLP